jgi:hypothetical protein
MKRLLGIGAVCAIVAASAFILPASASSTHNAASAMSPTERIAGPQHWCNTNGIECMEPYQNWEDFPAYQKLIKQGVHLSPYIGHDEPATLFYSNQPGSGNNVVYGLRLPKDPPVTPRQDGSGGTDNFQLHPAFWLGMIMCDKQGSPNPDGTALSGHATVPCKRDSDSNIYTSTDPSSNHYFGLSPGQAYMEMQFYPPGWAPWPAGISCTADQWCAALNIDTFSENQNTGQFNNNDCLNTVGPEPVNFAFLTNDGTATAPANPQHPEHFVPDPSKDFLMGSGDTLQVHMSDSKLGFQVEVKDTTTGKTGLMTASAANGFGSVVFDPSATSCKVNVHAYHPMFSTSSPSTRVTAAAHSYNVAFSDEIGHFEYCSKVKDDALGTCSKPGGADTNDPDRGLTGGDDEFCLPASASLSVKIGGCLYTDGDFDGSSYDHAWPGSISDPAADQLLNPQPIRFTSPTSHGQDFTSMAFEADLPRIESDDTAFGVKTPCQRHITNPADPDPGKGCVNPPPGAHFYPFYSTTSVAGKCWWQFGGPYIPHTTHEFGGSSKAEFGKLFVLGYPTAPYGTVTTRYNNFQQALDNLPCKAA